MKNKFLGIVCLLYSGIIIYVWRSNTLKNFLAPNMQIYLKIALFLLILLGVTMLINNKTNYKFKISDLVLLLPIVLLLMAQDGKLTTNLASNRMGNFNLNKVVNNSEVKEKKEEEEELIELPEASKDETIEEKPLYDFTNPYFDVIDENYNELSNYITFETKASKYIDKTIRVSGFILNDTSLVPKNYFAIGKYIISCCVADATFTGFVAKYNMDKIKSNSWYQIEGVLRKYTDSNDYNNAMYIEVINMKEIDASSQEEYVYPCYGYGDGTCDAVLKYNLEY